MTTPDVEASVGVAIDPAALATLQQLIAKTLGKGATEGGKEMTASLRKALQKIAPDVAKLAAAAGQVGTKGAASMKMFTAGLNAGNRETVRLTRAMEALAQSQQVIQSAIVKSGVISRQEMIQTRIASDRLAQSEIENARNVAKIQANEIQISGQKQLVAARFAGQQRVQITRAVIENIARLERGLAATIAGIARTMVGAIGRAWDSITSVVRRGARSITNISHSADLSITQSINQSLRVRGDSYRNYYAGEGRAARANAALQERITRQSATRQAQTVEAIRRKSSAGLLGAATGRGIGPGLGAIGGGIGVGALLTAGFTRFSEIERLNKQFLALTQSVEKAQMLMAQIKVFAKETPFDLLGVADLAKGFLAMGTAAEDVLPQVRAIADAVALTGGGVQELNRIQRALGQVVSAGRLQGDELNQLAESLPGLNIRRMIAEQLGVTVPEMVKMQEAGKITAEMFVGGLIKSLQGDPRLVGASEDLAKTLGGRAANLKESFEDLGASIIGLFAGPIKSAILGTQMVFQGLADFIKGKGLSESLQTLRVALGGVATGLAAVSAAKGSIEVFALIGRAIGLILTPLGILTTTVGLLGGAIAVMMANSVPLRMAFRELGERVGQVAERVRDFAADKLKILGEFITRTVIPRLIDLADFISDHLIGAFETVARFIDDTVLPALGRFGGMVARGVLTAWRAVAEFITDTVVPALRAFAGYIQDKVFPVAERFAGVIADGFMAALGAVLRFGQRIKPYVQPAIDGFIQLGRALRAALGGDFSDLGKGAMGALSGLGRTIVNAWDAAFEALRPLAHRLGDFIKNTFSPENLKEAGFAILRFVERVGKTLGTIVTHPAFLAAMAGIVAAAVAIGARFIEGFFKGVWSNLGPLLGKLKDLLVDNFVNIVGVGLVAAFAFKTIIGPLIARFRSLGGEAGAGFGAGFAGSLKNIGGFTAGLSGSVKGGRPFGALAAMSAQVSDLQNQFRILGQPRKIDLDHKAITVATRDVRKLTASFTEAELRGLRMRDRIGAAMTAIGATITGARGLLSGVLQLGKAFMLPLGNAIGGAARGVGNIIGQILMPKDFQAAGRVAGQTFGQAWSGGIATIKTSWSNMMNQLRTVAQSQGTTIGRQFAQKLGAGLALGVGGFAAGRAEGAAGGSGLLSALGIGATGAALGMPILGAAAAGVSLIGTQIGKSAKAAADARERIRGYASAIENDLGPALENGAMVLTKWNDLLSDAKGSSFVDTIREQLKGLLPALNKAGVTSEDFAKAIIAGPAEVEALMRKIGGGGGLLMSLQFKALRRIAEEGWGGLQAFNDEQRDKTLHVFDAAPAFGSKREFDAAAADSAANVLKRAQLATREFYTDLKIANRAWDDFGGGAQTATAVVERTVRNLRQEDREFYRGLKQTNAAWDDFGAAGAAAGKTVEEAAADAQAAVDELDVAIERALRPRDVSGLQSSIANIILSLRGAGGIGGDIFDLGDKFDAAELIQLKEKISTELAPVIAAGIAEGITPAATFDLIRDDLIESLMDGVSDPTGQIRMALVKSLQGIKVGIIAEWADKTPLVGQEDIDWGNRFKIPAPKVKITKADVSVDADVKTKLEGEGSDAGFNLMAGLARGIGLGAKAAIAAAKGTADNLVTTVRGALGIKSPSTVFADIGRFMMEGLELGVDASATDVTNAVVSAIDSAVAKAVDAAKAGSETLRAASSALFGATVGPGSTGTSGSLMSGLGSFTSSIKGFKDAIAGSISAAFDVALKVWEKTPLSAGEADVFGESAFSLSPSDVLGAGNLDALRSVLDGIVSFGADMLELGAPASDVVNQMKSFRDQLIFTSGALGFSTDDVRALVDSLGLSDMALANFVAGIGDLTTAAGVAVEQAKAAALLAKQMAMPGGTSNFTPGGMTTDESKRLRSLTLEALTLSAKDLEVFMRENGLDHNFLLNLQTLQADIMHDSHEQLQDLGRIFGLWGTSLDGFVTDLEDWLSKLRSEEPGNPNNQPLPNPWALPPGMAPLPNPDAPEPGSTEVTHLPRPEINVNIYPPYGDPLAIGLASANSVAMAARIPGH